jgi:hypothetical protein
MRTYETRHQAASIARAAAPDDVALFRIWAEFAEMPGLTLTLPQASRLFQLEAGRCLQALGSLVDAGQLVRRGDVFLRTPSA